MINQDTPDLRWLSSALTEALGVRTDVPFEVLIHADGRIRCSACVRREINRALADPFGALAPVLLEHFMRQLEPLVVEVK